MSRDDFSTRNEWDEGNEMEDEQQRPGQRSSQPTDAGNDRLRARRSSLPPNVYRDESGRLRRIRQNRQPGQPGQPRQTGQRPPVQGRQGQPRNTGSQGYTPSPAQRQTRDFRGEHENDINNYNDDEAYRRQRLRQHQQRQPPYSEQRPLQRPRQPNSREEDAYYQRARSRQPARQDADYDDGYDDNYEDEAGYYDASAYDTPTTTRKRTGSNRRGRRRGNWSTLLVGCIGGILTIAIIVGILLFVLYRSLPGILPGLGVGTSAYSDKPQSVTLPVTNAITRVDIHNPVGNVTVSVDYNATNGTLTYTKKTQATSSSNAATEFARMLVTAKPGGSATTCPATSCLAITATLPGGASDSVDMNIVLPAQNPSPVFTLSSMTQKGNVSVQGFRGLLSLADDTGNISVTGGLLAAGSCLQSRIGNVSFAGTIETTVAPTINPCAGNPITPNAGNASNQPWYSMKTGTGNIDATFNTLSTNLMLNVTIANKGAIKGDFNLHVTQNPDGSSNYFGPLLPNTQPTAFLIMTVDVAGTITLHKAAA